MADRVLQRHDTAARWQQYNPILAEGELGIITDGAKGYKIGDGVTRWNDLPFPANPANVVQETGDSESAVMSQKAVTTIFSELDSKQIKIKLFGRPTSDSNPNIGDVYYITDLNSEHYKTLRKRVGIKDGGYVFETVPFYDDSIYIYNNELYIWNGEELVKDTESLSKELSELNAGIVKCERIKDLQELSDYYFNLGLNSRYYGSDSFTEEGYYNKVGEVSEKINYRHTKPIQVSSGQVLVIQGLGANIPYFVYCSEEGKFLSSGELSASASKRTTIKLNDGFIILNARYTEWSNPASLKSCAIITEGNSLSNVKLELENEDKRILSIIGSSSVENVEDNIELTDWENGHGIVVDSGIKTTAASSSISQFIAVNNYDVIQYSRPVSTSSTAVVGMTFYDSKKNHIQESGQSYAVNGEVRGLVDAEIKLPLGASYVRFTCFTELLSDFYVIAKGEKITYQSGLGLDVQNCERRIFELENSGVTDELDPILCRRRFYEEMGKKCEEYGISDYIIEGPSGFGLGGEVEVEILGRGMSQLPMYGLIKIMAMSLGYEELSNIWSKDVYTIKTKGVETEIKIARSLDSHYGDVIEKDYTILGWKTGSNGGLTNLMCAVTCDELKGNVLVGVISRSYNPDTEDNNRSLSMKHLLDIGLAKFLDRNSNITEMEQGLIGQHTVSAMVAICPPHPRFMHHWDLINSDYYNLYTYDSANKKINTMSMIKVLVAEVVLDYVKNLDEYVIFTSEDKNAATGGTGAIFTAGQEITYRDLLMALLLPSSNQAGYALARNVGGILLRTY